MTPNAGVWASTLGAVALVTLISFVGAGSLALNERTLRKALTVLIPFAAGALLGDAFLHIIPEIAETERGIDTVASTALIGGVLAFFILEKILHWHHAHFPSEEVVHPVAVSNLVGDALHNLIDGSIIAASFIVSPTLGIATTLAVLFHEIPQELGDFAILLHSGLTARRALLLNFLSGCAAIAGAVLALSVSGGTEAAERILLPVAAGAFVYISSTDLIPELHKEPEPRKSVLQAAALILGVGVMFLLLLFEGA